MFGDCAGALAARHIPFDPSLLTASVEGRVVPAGKTLRIQSIKVHYELTAPPEHRDAIERALHVHTAGCPAHESVKEAIDVSWDAMLHLGDEVVDVRSA
jgi:uncharacterized OsmC-like protein